MKHTNPEQYVLPFESRKNELLAQVNLLRNVPTQMAPVRQDKVVELLERLLLKARQDLLELDGCVHVRAHMTELASGIDRRFTVSSRTVATWRTWAEQLGVLETDFRSQRYGRREWNMFIIKIQVIRDIIKAGSGLKWPEGTSSPRVEGTSSPRVEGTSSPCISINRLVETNSNRERLVVVVASCGLGKAEEAVDTALHRLGLSNCDIEHRIAAWRALPGDEQRPGTLFNWLAKRGSFEADQTARSKSTANPRPRVPDEVRRQQSEEFARARAAAREMAQTSSLRDEYLAATRARENQTVTTS
jgi:hypothetical protein